VDICALYQILNSDNTKLITVLLIVGLLLVGLTVIGIAIKIRVVSVARQKAFVNHISSFNKKAMDTLYYLDRNEGNLTENSIDKKIKQVLNVLCDNLVDVFIISTGKKKNIHSSYIQILKTTKTEMKREFPEYPYRDKDAFVTVFARDKESKKVRKIAKNKSLLSQNTDFEKIFFSHTEDTYFHSTNLLKYAKQNNYSNPSDYYPNEYKSAIVVPVCSYSFKSINDRTGEFEDRTKICNIIGFLCIDSKSTHTFRRSNKSLEIMIMQDFAQILYFFLTSCNKYYKSLTKTQGKRKGKQIS